MVEKHYDADELAELLGITAETVREKARTGEIASVRIGRLRRFPESAVRAFLAKNEQNVTPLPVKDGPARSQQFAKNG